MARRMIKVKGWPEKNGLVLPPKKEEVKKVKDRLELKFEDQRIDAGKAFSKLLNLGSVRGGLLGDNLSDIRSKLIRNLAEILLGDDWDCEILC